MAADSAPTSRQQIRLCVDALELHRWVVQFCKVSTTIDDGVVRLPDGQPFRPLYDMNHAFMVLAAVAPEHRIGLWFDLGCSQKSPEPPEWCAFLGSWAKGPSPMIATCKACLIHTLDLGGKAKTSFDRRSV